MTAKAVASKPGVQLLGTVDDLVNPACGRSREVFLLLLLVQSVIQQMTHWLLHWTEKRYLVVKITCGASPLAQRQHRHVLCNQFVLATLRFARRLHINYKLLCICLPQFMFA